MRRKVLYLHLSVKNFGTMYAHYGLVQEWMDRNIAGTKVISKGKKKSCRIKCGCTDTFSETVS